MIFYVSGKIELSIPERRFERPVGVGILWSRRCAGSMIKMDILELRTHSHKILGPHRRYDYYNTRAVKETFLSLLATAEISQTFLNANA